MDPNFYSLHTLQSLSSEQIEHLHTLGIANLSDLLAYQPFRYAQFIQAANDNLLRKDEIAAYLDTSVQQKELHEILDSPTDALIDLGSESASILKQLGISTISDLANYPPFAEAEEIVGRTVSEDSDPFAPAGVLPTCKKFTRNGKSFISFFKQDEIRNLSILSSDTSLISNLFRFGVRDPKVIYLGFSVSFLQEWIYCGLHLGEPQGSVNLFMGQDTQVSVLDWHHALTALRKEDTRVAERLSSTLFHQRAVDEVARATAEEHQYGSTSAFGVNAATAGSFVAAGALVGGVGGGISGALTGLVVGNVANVAGGAPTIAGAAIGTVVGSVAGAAAGSLIFSGATALGFVETHADGDRDIVSQSAQNIQQRTIQNSSSLRSFWSNIIGQNVQEEQQRLQTDRVTNHNRIHALNALYFEVLNGYRLNISVNDFAPILFLPFKPITFTEEILRRYWWLIRILLDDKKLVLALDEYFLSLSSDPSPAAALAELPNIAEIETNEIEVEVNLDGSMMETLIKAIVGSLLVGPAMTAFYLLFSSGKRDNIKVSIITSEGTYNLTRQNLPNNDPNYVGLYSTSSRIPVHTIEKIEITNTNAEFSLDVLGNTYDLNELAFENITAQISIRDKNTFTQALPNIGALEDKRTVCSRTFKIGAHSNKDIAWDIADRLRAQYDGVNEVRAELEEELGAVELTAAKIENLLSFLNANKFGFTRFILQNTEREQMISVLEGVDIGGIDLTAIASSTPLGFCGNHVVLPLKNRPIPGANHDPMKVDTTKLELYLRQFYDRNPKQLKDLRDYFTTIRSFLGEFVKATKSEDNDTVRGKQLLHHVKNLLTALDNFFGCMDSSAPGGSKLSEAITADTMNVFETRIDAEIRKLIAFLNTPIQTNSIDVARLYNYYGSVKKSLERKIGQLISSAEISLPSPAIFMEPVLSHAKGAELYDMQRNSHYEILSAPGIGTADPNVSRAQDIQLTPNVPASSLTIQNAPEYPVPASAIAALSEAGKLNLSTLISTNAGTLTSTLSNLATVASELAKSSAQLTGDAQKQALTTAGDVAKQVSDIINTSLKTPMPSSPNSTPAPPKTQQDKAEVNRELDRINKGAGTESAKREKKQTIGAPVAQDDTRTYQMSILFLDENEIPYQTGDFTLNLAFFELGRSFDINAGNPILFSKGQYFFPDTFTRQKGRMATIYIDANIECVIIPGIKDFILPDKPDIIFKCRMMSEIHKITATDIKSAVDEAIQNSSFGAALNPIFSSFLNAAVGFPFRIFKISADGGSKTELNLRGEYSRSNTSTTTGTTGSTTVTEYEVIIPKNGWDIEVV